MPLLATNTPPIPTQNGMTFPMKNGLKTIYVLVTFEALQGVVSPPRTNAQSVEAFRAEFEAAAIAKFDKGKIEPNGAVIVRAADLLRNYERIDPPAESAARTSPPPAPV